MSYVLERIIVPVAPRRTADRVDDCNMKFDILPLDGETSILARPGRPSFDDAVCELARSLSIGMGVALLVRWDDRVELRESQVFPDGSRTHRFNNEDELYVLLDDDGIPIHDGRKYRETECDNLPDEEFQFFQNALKFGCEQSGFCSWQRLYDFIQRQA